MDITDSKSIIKLEFQNGYKALSDAVKLSNQLQVKKCESQTSDLENSISFIAKRAISMVSTILKTRNVKGNILNCDVNEKFDVLSSINDKLLDKANENMAILNGVNSNPPEATIMSKAEKTPRSSWSDNIKRTILQIKEKDEQSHSRSHYLTRNIEKPQLMFKDVIDNTPVPFVPPLTDKPNAMIPLSIDLDKSFDSDGSCCNPYAYEINHFSFSEWQLARTTPVTPLVFDNAAFVYVDNEEKLTSMINDLSNEKEIAVDTENHSYRSFQGFCCLIQISTRFQDYIVDAIILRDKLWHLNKIFTNPKIVKVLHGAELDIVWLQRDFGLYVVNMFDTRQASLTLNFQQLSLAYLLQKYCSVDTNKQYQLFDWRIRPLPSEAIKYARIDTHYLLYIYDKLRNALLEAVDGETNLLKLVYDKSSAICIQRYEKDIITEDSYLKVYKLGRRNFDNRRLLALKKLYDWRDNIARKEDESAGYVLPNHMLLQIADSLPREPQGILACCNPIPNLVKKHLDELYEIVLKARNEPIVKLAIEQLEQRRSYYTQGPIIPQQVNLHDTTNSPDFRNDLPTLLSGTDAVINDSDVCATKFMLNVFNEEILNSNLTSFSHKRQISFLSPYERYEKTILFNEAQKEKEDLDKTTNVNELDSTNDIMENTDISEISNYKDEQTDGDISKTINNTTVKSEPMEADELCVQRKSVKTEVDVDTSITNIKQETSEDTIKIINPRQLQADKRKRNQTKESIFSSNNRKKQKSEIPISVDEDCLQSILENLNSKKKIEIMESRSDLPSTSTPKQERNKNGAKNFGRSFAANEIKRDDRKNLQTFDYSKANFTKFMTNTKVAKSLKNFSTSMGKKIWARKQKRRQDFSSRKTGKQ